MAGRTNSDKVDDVIREVATLNERINHVREEIKRIDMLLEENEKKRWNLMTAVFTAMLGLIASLFVLLVRKE